MYFFPVENTIASAIGTHMDEKEEHFSVPTLNYLMTNFQFQPFPFNPTGKAPRRAGPLCIKKD